MPGQQGSVLQRFWRKVDPAGQTALNGTRCWMWTGAVSPRGYGKFRIDRHTPIRQAHRVAYQLLVGPIPEGLTIDHLCGVKPCVNPDHFEVVTRSENAIRGNRIRWQRKAAA